MLSQTPASPQDCDITVYFGSFASGIDRQAEARLQAYLEANADVAHAIVGRRGREGEYTACLRVANQARADEVFAALAALLPKGSRTAPTTVSRRDRQVY